MMSPVDTGPMAPRSHLSPSIPGSLIGRWRTQGDFLRIKSCDRRAWRLLEIVTLRRHGHRHGVSFCARLKSLGYWAANLCKAGVGLAAPNERPVTFRPLRERRSCG